MGVANVCGKQVKKKYKGRKMPIVKIYLKAFNNKIVPIMLTILSTILGLVPFVVYGQNNVFWFALAIGSIGGLLFSLVVIVFYLPLFVISKHRKR
jgi:multidrug efflux pump subunit AcrB